MRQRKHVYANMHCSDPETSDRLLYILFQFKITKKCKQFFEYE